MDAYRRQLRNYLNGLTAEYPDYTVSAGPDFGPEGPLTVGNGETINTWSNSDPAKPGANSKASPDKLGLRFYGTNRKKKQPASNGGGGSGGTASNAVGLAILALLAAILGISKTGGGGGAARASAPAEPAGAGSCSFEADTPILMADGTTKNIEDIVVGDLVVATDPGTGLTYSEPVTALHSNDDVDMADLTVQTESGEAVVHTTANHPFWDVSTQAWMTPDDLNKGDYLYAGPGQTVTVIAVRTWFQHEVMLNLTIQDLHSYYVVADHTPILVHNICRGEEL
jgi:hypothetical protein